MSQLSEILHGDSKSGSNNKSFIARLGQLGQKYTDPLAWAFGRKYTDRLVDIADLSNKAGSTVGRPFVKADKTLNPLRRIGAYDKVASWTEAKPGDTGAIAAGGYFAGGAAGGGAGSSGYAAGGSGATGGAGAGAATGASVAGGAAEAIPEVVVTGSTGSGLGMAATGAGVGAGGATAANSNSGQNWRDQLQMPGQQDNSEQAQADENRRQLELMIEQERLRREAFRRNQIARAMG